MRSLKNVKATIQYGMSMEAGNASGTLTEEIKDPNNFSLKYPVVRIDPKRGQMPALVFDRANGKDINEATGGNTQTLPLSSKNAAPQDLVDSWPLIGFREVFAGMLDGRQPFSEYLTRLADPKNGYQTTVTERSQIYKGVKVTDYKIDAVRSGSMANLRGASAVSMIIDADIHLPVEITAVVKKPGASREDRLDWSASWLNNVKFDPKDFQPAAPLKKI